MASGTVDPHARHTTEQMDALERAHALVDDAIAALDTDVLDDFENEDLAEVWRTLRTAHLWLTEVLDAEGHGSAHEGEGESAPSDHEQPIH